MPHTADLTQNLTPEERKHLLAHLLSPPEAEAYPLSLAQQRIWFLEQFVPGTSAYNVPVGLRLKGTLDRRALLSSLGQIVERHSILRTTFRMEENQTVQVVAAECAVSLSFQDFGTVPHPARESEVWQAARQETAAPFDLAAGPLIRATLFRLDDEQHVLVCVLHHIVCDAWSIAIFLREWAALYSAACTGEPANLPELAIQYSDYAQWQREWAESEVLAEDVVYWKRKLAGIPERLELPTDRERPPEQTYDGQSQTIPLPDALVEDLKALARSNHATLFMVMVAAFQVLASAYSGSEDIALGIPVAGRGRLEIEGLIGFFVNTVVLRTDLTGDPSFITLLARVRETALEALAHAEIPFERLVEELRPARSMSHNPLFQVMCSAIKDARPPDFGPLATAPYALSSGGSPFDLSVNLIEDTAEHGWVTFEYNTALFDYARVAIMMQHYVVLLSAIVQEPASALSVLMSQMHGQREASEVERAPAIIVRPRIVHKPTPSSAAPNPGRGTPDALEQILSRIWEKTLERAPIGLHDDFFDLGGHSLLAARLVSEVEKIIGRKVPLAALFRGPTLGSFAELIRQGAENNPDPLLMQVKAGSHRIPLFAIAAPGVDTLGFALLARHIGEHHSMFKIQSHAEQSATLPYTEEELRSIAAEYVTAMRTFQPRGPYCLVATCGGVHIAERMVHLLEARGHEVGAFAIIDTWVLENRYIRSLARLDSLYQRISAVSRTPLKAQLSFYRRAVATRLRRYIARPELELTNPWDRTYYPPADFRPRQFDAAVLLFKRPRQPYFCTRDPQMGWGLRSRAGVDVHPIKAAHEAMLREPAVEIIGQRLAQALDRLGTHNLTGEALPAPTPTDVEVPAHA